jgi:hypothetical protein
MHMLGRLVKSRTSVALNVLDLNSPARKARARYRYRQAGGHVPGNDDVSMRAALAWLCRAQDVVGGGGFARAYSLLKGWDLPYPETTGYIIPTFLEASHLYPDLQLFRRAWSAGRWLVAVQFESGAICSKQWTSSNDKPSVFNTGMVLHGWVSLLERQADSDLAEAARRAAAWLVREQDSDGAWRRNAFNGIAHTYYTMVDWALIRYGTLTGDNAATAAAVRHLEWTVASQTPNGWFLHCEFAPGEAVTTHTISYTTQGLVAAGALLGEERYIEAARRGAQPLLEQFRQSEGLAGTFAASWEPTAAWDCVTGNAQTSIVWQLLARSTGDQFWLDTARALNLRTLTFQRVACTTEDIDGAIPGSWPITGAYDALAFPNHAAKFHVDALCLARGSSPSQDID